MGKRVVRCKGCRESGHHKLCNGRHPACERKCAYCEKKGLVCNGKDSFCGKYGKILPQKKAHSVTSDMSTSQTRILGVGPDMPSVMDVGRQQAAFQLGNEAKRFKHDGRASPHDVGESVDSGIVTSEVNGNTGVGPGSELDDEHFSSFFGLSDSRRSQSGSHSSAAIFGRQAAADSNVIGQAYSRQGPGSIDPKATMAGPGGVGLQSHQSRRGGAGGPGSTTSGGPRTHRGQVPSVSSRQHQGHYNGSMTAPATPMDDGDALLTSLLEDGMSGHHGTEAELNESLAGSQVTLDPTHANASHSGQGASAGKMDFLSSLGWSNLDISSSTLPHSGTSLRSEQLTTTNPSARFASSQRYTTSERGGVRNTRSSGGQELFSSMDRLQANAVALQQRVVQQRQSRAQAAAAQATKAAGGGAQRLLRSGHSPSQARGGLGSLPADTTDNLHPATSEIVPEQLSIMHHLETRLQEASSPMTGGLKGSQKSSQHHPQVQQQATAAAHGLLRHLQHPSQTSAQQKGMIIPAASPSDRRGERGGHVSPRPQSPRSSQIGGIPSKSGPGSASSDGGTVRTVRSGANLAAPSASSDAAMLRSQALLAPLGPVHFRLTFPTFLAEPDTSASGPVKSTCEATELASGSISPSSPKGAASGTSSSTTRSATVIVTAYKIGRMVCLSTSHFRAFPKSKDGGDDDHLNTDDNAMEDGTENQPEIMLETLNSIPSEFWPLNSVTQFTHAAFTAEALHEDEEEDGDGEDMMDHSDNERKDKDEEEGHEQQTGIKAEANGEHGQLVDEDHQDEQQLGTERSIMSKSANRLGVTKASTSRMASPRHSGQLQAKRKAIAAVIPRNGPSATVQGGPESDMTYPEVLKIMLTTKGRLVLSRAVYGDMEDAVLDQPFSVDATTMSYLARA
eukprot:Clim_evm21s108 gene=Clim_evmTU21s108